MYSLHIEPRIEKDALLRFMGGGEQATLSNSLRKKLGRFSSELDQILKPRTLHRTVHIQAVERSGVVLDGGVLLRSAKLAKTLKNCKEAICFLVTSGPGLDAEVSRLNRQGDVSLAYILDVLGSAATESMAQRLQDHIADQIKRNGQRVTYRFSPGYCDWPVTEQKKLFRFLEAGRIGVRLLDSCLMQPRKTISGIFGLEEAAQDKMPPPYNPCRDCGRTQCRERRK